MNEARQSGFGRWNSDLESHWNNRMVRDVLELVMLRQVVRVMDWPPARLGLF